MITNKKELKSTYRNTPIDNTLRMVNEFSEARDERINLAFESNRAGMPVYRPIGLTIGLGSYDADFLYTVEKISRTKPTRRNFCRIPEKKRNAEMKLDLQTEPRFEIKLLGKSFEFSLRTYTERKNGENYEYQPTYL